MSFPNLYVSAIASIRRPRALSHPGVIPLQVLGASNQPPTPPKITTPPVAHLHNSSSARFLEKPETSPGGPTFRPPEEEDLDEESVFEEADDMEEEVAKGTLDPHKTSPYRDGEDELAYERAGEHKKKKVEAEGSKTRRGADDLGMNFAGDVEPVEESVRETWVLIHLSRLICVLIGLAVPRRYKKNEARLKGKMEHGEGGL